MSEPSREELLQHLIDAMPSISLVVDREVTVVAFNASAGHALRIDAGALRQLAGNVLSCVNALSGVCGRTVRCNGCEVRGAIERALAGEPVHRRPARMRLKQGGAERELTLLVTAAPIARAGEGTVLLAVEDVTELAALRALLPVCALCGTPRNEPGYLEELTRYLRDLEPSPFPPWTCRGCRPVD
jgi:hypothetical protein